MAALAIAARAGRRVFRQGDRQRSRSRQARGPPRPARPDARRGPPGRRFLADRGLNGTDRRIRQASTSSTSSNFPTPDRPNDPLSSTASAAASPTARRATRNLLGGKGANLAEMASIGLPVPPGFTISTEMCARLLRRRRALSATACAPRSPRASPISRQVTGKSFGDAADPLLVSVRSGARVSMPGMMDTVLNLGLNDATVAGPRRRLGRSALRLGQLSPLHPDVFRRRARPRSRRVRGGARDRQGGQGRPSRHRARGRGLASG